MRIQLGDTVVVDERTKSTGIVERRDGNHVVVRRPDLGNQRETFSRGKVKPLAEAMAEARARGSKYKNDLSLTGQSTLALLVAEFGYSTLQMRRDSLVKVIRQLARAGLEIVPASTDWARDDTFVLKVVAQTEGTGDDEIDAGTDEAADEESAVQAASLPGLYWPRALGLEQGREIAFLRALGDREPVLCVLTLPEDASLQSWLGSTWEGLASWAFRSAQRFMRQGQFEFSQPEVLVGGVGHLQAYLQPTLISSDTARLKDRSHSLNLITLKGDADWPVDASRLRAIWPGPVFEFSGQDADSSGDAVTSLLRMVGGRPVTKAAQHESSEKAPTLSPLGTLLWARTASEQLLGQGALHVAEVLSRKDFAKLKGSNEGSTSLALKARLAAWLGETSPDTKLSFENDQDETIDEDGSKRKLMRIDLNAGDQGVFEVESLSGSGPWEAFVHQKVFSRLRDGRLFNLVVPNDALVWAGVFLADVAHHLHDRGRVLLSRADGGFYFLSARSLKDEVVAVEAVETVASTAVPLASSPRAEEPQTRLEMLAGYEGVKERLHNTVVWPYRHRQFLKGASKTSGVLFFGPPGCGKSRLAQAIAGTLSQEVRLTSPADMRGPYVGWGQIMIREHFSWLSEREGRMLVIDELDGVARSRRTSEMHSDEKADVNELLVQLDRALRIGRIVVGTTNFIEALDEAVVRSGRIGSFVPVPPPTDRDSAAIVSFYLERLAKGQNPEGHPARLRLTVPKKDEVEAILTPLQKQNRQAEQYFCGADLETAVNDAVLLCLRRGLPHDAAQRPGEDFAVELGASDLEHTLKASRRSINKDSFARFLAEVGEFCGEGLAKELQGHVS